VRETTFIFAGEQIMRISCKKNFHNDKRRCFETPESLYVARNVSRWLVRLSDHGAPLGADFFEALSWSNGGVEAIARYALDIIEGSSLADANEVTEAINALRDYDSEKGRRYPFFALAKRSKNFAALDSIVREAIRSVVGKAIKKMKPGVTSYSIAKCFCPVELGANCSVWQAVGRQNCSLEKSWRVMVLWG
jgi:hypothetical protein